MALIGTVSGTMSGSLTTLGDGTSYLIAGSNITIATGSGDQAGPITITSTGGGSTFVTGNFFVPAPGEFVTTASVSFAGGDGFNTPADSVGDDTIFFVSGSKGAAGKEAGGTSTSVFGGDLVVSGAIFGGFDDDANYTISYFLADQSYISSTGHLGNVGNDIFLFVSGSSSRADDLGDKGVAAFGGDLVLSGKIFAGGDEGELEFLSNRALFSSEEGDANANPGEDTVFYVSGTSYGGSWTSRHDGTGVSVFGGDTLFSASLVIYDGESDPGDETHLFSLGALPDESAWPGDDLVFFVSGTGGEGGKEGGGQATAVFGGDLVVSGAIFGGAESGQSEVQLIGDIIALSNTGNWDAGQDWAVFLSGSVYQYDGGQVAGKGVDGTTVVGGDMVVSGNLYGGVVDQFQGSNSTGMVIKAVADVFRYTGGINEHAQFSTPADVNFHVSGSTGLKDDTSKRATALFDGDVVVSGTIYDGSGNAVGGTVGGSDTQIQYNDGGGFGGTADLTFNDATGDVTVGTSTGDAKLFFRDSGNYIYSNADGDLDIINADGTATNSLVLECTAGGIDINAGGVFTIDGVGASNVTTNGALTLSGSTAVNVLSHGGMITIDSTTASVDVDCAGTLNLDGASGVNIGTAADVAVDLDASTLDIDASGAITIDSTSTFSVDGVGASNVTTVGALTVSGSSGLNLHSHGGEVDITATQGAVDINSTTTTTIDATTTLSAKGATGASFGDDTGTWEFNGSGAVTETGMTSLSVTPSGAITLTAGAASTWSTTTGNLTIDAAGELALDTDGTDAINLGTEAAAKTITIGNDASTKVDVNALAIELDSAGTIVLNSTTTTDVDSTGILSLNSGAAINIGNDDDDFAINIGGTGTRTITLGSTTSTLALNTTGGASTVTVKANTASAMKWSDGTDDLLSINSSALATYGTEGHIVVGHAGTANEVALIPGADNVFNLGTPTARWANIYTGDLHLSNDRGNWTVVEENDFLSLRNNKNGKTYKLLMEEIIEE